MSETSTIAALQDRIERLESFFDLDAVDDTPICTDDHFIKLTGYDHKPVFVKTDAITRLRLMDDTKPYTRIYTTGGDFSVWETPEQIMESLGYKKNEE